MAEYSQFGTQGPNVAPWGEALAWGEAGAPSPAPMGWGSTYAMQRADTGSGSMVPTATEAATPTAFAGSSMDTLYGIDSESFLTDDQKKLARMIQWKFYTTRRPPRSKLVPYTALFLSGALWDEALARAMSLARGLNYGAPDALGNPVGGASRGGGGSGGGYGGGGGSAARPGGSGTTSVPRYPTITTPKTPAAPAQKGTDWSKIMSGLSSIAPLLFGKDAWGNFLNKGLIGSIKDQLFGPAGSMIDDRVLENMITSGALPDAGGFAVHPITGMPLGVAPGYEYPNSYAYGPESGWGLDVVPGGGYGGDGGGYWGEDGYWYPNTAGGIDDPYGIGGWDSGWDTSWGGGSEGFWDEGYWYPQDTGSWWDAGDPYAIGGW